MIPSTKEKLLILGRLKTERVTLKTTEQEIQVNIREMTAVEREHVIHLTEKKCSNSQILFYSIQKCVLTEQGTPLFEIDDQSIDLLTQPVLKELGDHITRLSGFDEGSVEKDLGK